MCHLGHHLPVSGLRFLTPERKGLGQWQPQSGAQGRKGLCVRTLEHALSVDSPGTVLVAPHPVCLCVKG